MTPFEEVWEYVDKIPGSFTRLNAEKLYECALRSDGQMVEVGVDQGRSASVLMFAARHTGASIFLVDSWRSLLAANERKVADRFGADFRGVKWSICNAPSIEAAALVNGHIQFSLIHIDADHYDDAPGEDCEAWLPKLKAGGFACFHDYGRTCGEPFVAVDEAVNKYTAGWEDLGTWECLGIRRKPC